jgi:hypothetical protein
MTDDWLNEIRDATDDVSDAVEGAAAGLDEIAEEA